MVKIEGDKNIKKEFDMSTQNISKQLLDELLIEVDESENTIDMTGKIALFKRPIVVEDSNTRSVIQLGPDVYSICEF